MKRLVVVLGGLLALPAFAEVAPFFYDDVAEYADAEMMDDGAVVGDEIVAEDTAVSAPVVQSNPAVRANVPMRSASRALPSEAALGNRSSNTSRAVASRGTTAARATTGANRVVASRAANTTPTAVSTRSTSNNANVARAGNVTTRTVSGKTSDITTSDTTNNPLYLSNARVGVRTSSARAPSIAAVSVSNNTAISAESIKETTSTLDSLTELTDYCKAQYAACMDNFCNVLDDNQGRCSCSKNIKNYEKTENALKAATEELQEVAQKIQYIGLTKDEVTTLFNETEAEVAMRSTSDSSQIKSNLDKIKNMIVDVKTGTASGMSDTGGISLDLSNLLSFNIDSTGFDLTALFGGTSSNTSSIANQRGETLYKTATSRCKAAVLNSCTSQGVDAAVITNSYDLEIDKQCVAYERALTDSNSEMTATVRNAKTVLQKARLLVAQQKNQYDLRGCVSALDSCMQDDYVCGSDYEYCLDPTGKYIVDGAIVTGSLPGKPLNEAASNAGMFNDGLYVTWKNGSTYAWDTSGSQNGDLAAYINGTVSSNVTEPSPIMSKFLQYKIGYNSSGKNYGMCISVLNKCQDYTYNNGTYNPKNNVVIEYMYRVLPRIKASQDTLLSSYAENCISDVTSCLASNNYGNTENAKKIAVNACKSLITTCMSVNGNVAATITPSEMSTWADNVYQGIIGSTSGN